MIKKIGNRLLCLSLLMAAISLPFISLKVFADAPDVATVKQEKKDAFSDMRLCPGGDVFGIRMFMPGVMVVNLGEVVHDGKHAKPAEEGGIAKGDLITRIDGKEIHHVGDLTNAVKDSDGKPLSLTLKRQGKEFTLTVTPALSESDGNYHLGVWVRDRTAGIGTITFIDAKTGLFGGLGHGICDPDTGEVMPLERGLVTDVSIQGIEKGAAGAPGELRGALGLKKRGALTVNSETGVFGVLSDLPKDLEKQALPPARASEIKIGAAEIYCTLENGQKKQYQIEITKIHPANRETKCFSIRVTDKALLEATGGIVQGMSGSPIIQNGKLIGAVTHVFVNDPTRGYGIFIENMLAEAEKIK